MGPVQGHTQLGGRGKAQALKAFTIWFGGLLAMCGLRVPSLILSVVSQPSGQMPPAALYLDKAKIDAGYPMPCVCGGEGLG